MVKRQMFFFFSSNSHFPRPGHFLFVYVELFPKHKPCHGVVIHSPSSKCFDRHLQIYSKHRKVGRFGRMEEDENIDCVKLPRRSGVTVSVSFVLEPYHQIVNAGA